MAKQRTGASLIAFGGLIVYLVMLYMRPKEWVSMLRFLPGDYIVVVLTLVLALAMHRQLRKHPKPMSLPFLGAWVVVILLSNIQHGAFDTAQDQFIQYLKRVMIIVLVWASVDSVQRMKVVVILMVVQSGVLGLEALSQVRNGGFGWAGQYLDSDARVQWVGVWDGANVFSVLLLTSVPFMLEMLVGQWRGISRVLPLLCGPAVLTGLFLANSRGGYLATGLMLLLYFRTRVGNVGVIIGTAAVVGLFMFGPSRLSEINTEEESASSRVELWAKGMEMIRYYPVLGIGKGTYAEYTGDLIAHNTFIQNMGETGLIGLFVWMGIIYCAFKSLNVLRRYNAYLTQDTLSLGRAVFVCLVGYLAAGFFVSADFDLLYVLLGLAAATMTLAWREAAAVIPKSALRLTRRDLGAIAVLEVAAIIFMHVAVRILG